MCLIDPVGDVYACPFAIHDKFLAGNILSDNGFRNVVWQNADLFRELREPQSAGACGSCGHYDACRGGCMAAKFFTGLPLDGPDPECVQGHSNGRWPAAARSPGRPSTTPTGKRTEPVLIPLTVPEEILQRKSQSDSWHVIPGSNRRDRTAAREEAAAEIRLLLADLRQRKRA